MASTMRHLVAAAGLAFALLATAQAQQGTGTTGSAPAAAASAGSTDAISPLPRPDETNAERARTQPRNNAPFWRGVRESGREAGTVNNMPRGERGVLIQRFTDLPGSRPVTAGEAWRQVRNRWILPYGGALLVITCLALALFYWAKGKITVHEPPTGRLIERFTYFERAAHWVNAIAFVLLAVSGIFMAFGKAFILPVIGSVLFGWLTYALKTLHNFVGPAFAVSLAVMFFAYVRDNRPRWDDVKWLLKGGGFFTGAHVPSHRFNAGEKIVFWGGVLGLGSIVVASGFVLDKIVPGVDYTRGAMQLAHIVHAVATVLMMAMIAAHAYLGTIGMEGAYRAMRDGYVDESWAKEHHEYWYRDIKAGRIAAQRTPLPPAGQAERPAPQH
jgi:formate dehydrogenase subunit gamma